jgi:signal transduction histidine kinase
MSNNCNYRTENNFCGTKDGLWDYDVKSDIVTHSHQWWTTLQFHKNEISNSFTELTQLVHPEDIEIYRSDLSDFLLGKNDAYVSSCRFKCKNGNYKWILKRGVAASRSEDGRPLRILGTFADVTHVKTINNQLKTQEQQLLQVLSSLPEGVLVFSLTNQVLFYNQHLLELFSINLKHGERLSMLSFSESVGKKIEMSGQSGLFTAFSGDKKGILRLTDPARTIQWESHQVIDPELHNILFFRDITRETYIDKMKSEFLETVAHEMRTPLSSICGFVELLLSQNTSNINNKKFLGIIHAKSDELIKMLGEFLDVARIEAITGMDFNPRTASLLSVVNSVIEEYSLSYTTNQIQIKLPNEAPFALLDSTKLAQALLNIVCNAHKYSLGTGQVLIDYVHRQGAIKNIVGAHEQGFENTVFSNEPEKRESTNWVGIRVSDAGIGMDTEQLVHIFERFYRATNTAQIPGTGLGMSLVKDIMLMHGGCCEVCSHVGKGTQVILWLPEVNAITCEHQIEKLP